MRGRKREYFPGDSLHWYVEGVAASVCMLWWGLTHARAVAVAVRLIEEGAPVFSVNYEFHRVLVVWGATLALALATLLVFWAMRRRMIDGRSRTSWIFFLFGWVLMAAVLLTARSIRDRPVTADMWIVLAGSGWGFSLWFLRRRRGSKPPSEGDPTAEVKGSNR